MTLIRPTGIVEKVNEIWSEMQLAIHDAAGEFFDEDTTEHDAMQMTLLNAMATRSKANVEAIQAKHDALRALEKCGMGPKSEWS